MKIIIKTSSTKFFLHYVRISLISGFPSNTVAIFTQAIGFYVDQCGLLGTICIDRYPVAEIASVPPKLINSKVSTWIYWSSKMHTSCDVKHTG